MRAIAVGAAGALCCVLLSSCLFLSPSITVTAGGPREFSASFDASSIPEPIRSNVESDFPGYRIIDGSVDQDDALMTLMSETTTFTLDVDYRNPGAYGEGSGPYYLVTESPGLLDMRRTSDPQVRSLIAFFASRYPRGEYVFQGTSQEDPESAGNAYDVGVYRMHISGTPSPSGKEAPRDQRWKYDPATESWSSE